jgi:hypothetical protein
MCPITEIYSGRVDCSSKANIRLLIEKSPSGDCLRRKGKIKTLPAMLINDAIKINTPGVGGLLVEIVWERGLCDTKRLSGVEKQDYYLKMLGRQTNETESKSDRDVCDEQKGIVRKW